MNINEFNNEYTTLQIRAGQRSITTNLKNLKNVIRNFVTCIGKHLCWSLLWPQPRP